MERVDFSEIVRALEDIGLSPGDVVNVHSRLFAIGVLRGAPTSEIPDAYLKAFQQVLEDSGTVVVPTYTTSFARYGTPFIREKSPSEFGVFSEHVRTRPGSCRTLHPVQSLTALGGSSSELAEQHPRWNVGHDTIWDRMLQRDGKIVTVGIAPRLSMSFLHQVEFLACVPYLYNKIMRGQVFAEGCRVDDDFFMAVRYLQYGIAYDLSDLQKRLIESGAMRRRSLGGSALWSVPMQAVFEFGMQGLRRDPYYLLQEEPAFIPGEMPCDGLTIDREAEVPRYFLS